MLGFRVYSDTSDDDEYDGDQVVLLTRDEDELAFLKISLFDLMQSYVVENQKKLFWLHNCMKITFIFI